MAQVICKGTVLKRSIASVYTAVAQIISIDLPEFATETYDADTLDNPDAGIPKLPTGRTEGGEVKCELFFDPVLSTHTTYTADALDPYTRLNPSGAGTGVGHQIIFADSANTVWPFNVTGVSFGGTVAMNDGLKGSLTLTVNKTVTYP